MTSSPERAPDLKALVECARRAADVMGMKRPDAGQAEEFIRALVLGKQSEGGKDVAGCLEMGLITEIEARDLVMAHIATWLSRLNGVPEPSYDGWFTPELELQFETALLGRAARRR